ncbi:MAG: glycosyltransferase [Patescibacteria group bacterium]
MSEKLLSIIILNWNRKHYSIQTIENLIKKTTLKHELILVDNNSSEPGLRDYLLEVKGNENTTKIQHVFNYKNLGVAGGRNSGLVKASGDYLMTIDDDIIVPDSYDKLFAEACDKIPKLGITGVCVEPDKYSDKIINGVRCRPKNGNLGGACLCLPRRVFEKVGFYNYFSTYGHEDACMYYRLSYLGLISAYILPKGIHLDTDKDKAYRKEKNKAHQKGSSQLSALSRYLTNMRNTGNVFVTFDPNFEPCDQKIFTNDLILKDRK